MKRWGAVLLGIAVLMMTAGPTGATPVTDPAVVDEGFSVKTLLFILLGVLALIIVSSLGPLSRMAERREELRQEAKAKTENPDTPS